MSTISRSLAMIAVLLACIATPASAELLAMLNYETKPDQVIRKAGLAIVDADPTSPTFGKLLADIPLPPRPRGHRLDVTAAKPGRVNVYDPTDPRQPKLMKDIPAAAGAHHLVFSPDERYLFVQNSLLNLPGLSDSSITVIDVDKGEPIASIDTLKNMGFNPNCIVLLPARP